MPEPPHRRWVSTASVLVACDVAACTLLLFCLPAGLNVVVCLMFFMQLSDARAPEKKTMA